MKKALMMFLFLIPVIAQSQTKGQGKINLEGYTDTSSVTWKRTFSNQPPNIFSTSYEFNHKGDEYFVCVVYAKPVGKIGYKVLLNQVEVGRGDYYLDEFVEKDGILSWSFGEKCMLKLKFLSSKKENFKILAAETYSHVGLHLLKIE